MARGHYDLPSARSKPVFGPSRPPISLPSTPTASSTETSPVSGPQSPTAVQRSQAPIEYIYPTSSQAFNVSSQQQAEPRAKRKSENDVRDLPRNETNPMNSRNDQEIYRYANVDSTTQQR